MKTTLARTATIVFLLFCVTAYTPLFGTSARAEESPGESYEMFYPEQLDNLTARIALYPDPLLAQVLLAASFPQQIDEAARFLRAGANPDAIDDQPWDVSVRAVAHYPTVLFMMADDPDWTAALGQAYVYQSTDVMMAVQRLRAQARSRGHLVSTPQMAVVVDSGYISLWPVHPRYLYVPVYDPAIVFFRGATYWPHPVISFGFGFAIGAWLNYDCDWHRHRVYYHGWVPHGPRWVHRYRPHLHITHRYVHPRFAHVRPNRAVVHHRINYHKLNRHRAIHRHVNYENVRTRRSDLDRRHRYRPSDIDRHREQRIIRRYNPDRRWRTTDRNVDRSRTIREGRRSPETTRDDLRMNRSERKRDHRLREGRNRPAYGSERRGEHGFSSIDRTRAPRERIYRSERRSPQRGAERWNRPAFRTYRTEERTRVSNERTAVSRDRTNRSVRKSPQRLLQRGDRESLRNRRSGEARVSTERTQLRRERMSRSRDRRIERRNRPAFRTYRTEERTRVSSERSAVSRDRANRSVRTSPQRQVQRGDRESFRNRRSGEARVSTERSQVRRERMSRSQDRRMERRNRSAIRSSRVDGDRSFRGRRR